MSQLGGTSILSSQLLVYRDIIRNIITTTIVVNIIAMPLLFVMNTMVIDISPFDYIILFITNLFVITIRIYHDMWTTIDDIDELTVLCDELASYGISDISINYIVLLAANFRGSLTDKQSFESSLRDWNTRYKLNINDDVIKKVSVRMFE